MNVSNRSRWCLAGVMAAALLGSLFVAQSSIACPFCSAVSQTLRQEMATMDVVVIAESIEGTERDADTGEIPLRVLSILKGDAFVKVGDVVRSVYYGSVEPGRRFMLSGVEPQDIMWSSPLPVDKRAEEYLVKAMQLPEDDLERLRFYQNYLQDESSMLARDAYDEFAIAPYASVLKLKGDMNHDRLVSWIKDPEMPADRRRLYLVMLGVCGTEKDIPMLEEMLRSTQPSARTGLDSLIACYMTLAGKDSLKLVNELFLANKQAPYAETYHAIMAIRFHGTETDIIPRSELVSSLHHVLDRADLADLVIPDLARWGDWTQIDRLVKLFEAAEADNNWLRVPVVNYMRACPLPEAALALERLKEIDPEAVKRANTFFTAPVPPPEKTPATSSVDRPSLESAAQELLAETKLADPTNEMNRFARATLMGIPYSNSSLLAQRTTQASLANVPAKMLAPLASVSADQSSLANPIRLLTVMATVVATLMILAYLVLSGGPQPSRVLVRSDNRR